MAKKNLFNAETVYSSSSSGMTIEKKAVIVYTAMVPYIQAHGKSMPLSNKSFGIGRDKSNAVIVSDSKVSKYHATIVFKKGKAFIRDAGSTNGTWINKGRIPDNKQVELKNKDLIVVGTTQILYKN